MTTTIEEIRRANLAILVAEVGDQTNLAKLCNTSPTYLSQILTRFRKQTGKIAEVGSKLARKLEVGTGKPEGWMDKRQDDVDPAESELVNIFATLKTDRRNLLLQYARTISKK